jgi:2-(1,2-epoxy-1,2-dihydrophenyl)acetyl-CoA isomerase
MDALLCTCDDGVATVVLNRPDARNALDFDLVGELDTVLARITRDDTVRALILTGAGGTFCAGGDLRAMNTPPPRPPQTWHSNLRRVHRVVRALHGLDRPVIAAVDGVAFGAGFSIALLADMVLVSNRARFCMAFARVGLAPDYGALYTLPRVVGLQRAKEILYSGREISAAEALQLGIALEVLAPADLLPRARALAQAFTGASPTALAITKEALNASLGSELDTMLQLEASAQGIAGTSDYARDAFRRFAAREPAQFQWPALPVGKP